MESRPLTSDEENIACLIPDTVSISQFIIHVLSFCGEIEDEKLRILNQFGDVSYDSSRTHIFVNTLRCQCELRTLLPNHGINSIPLLPFERHCNTYKIQLEGARIVRIIVVSSEFATHEWMAVSHSLLRLNYAQRQGCSARSTRVDTTRLFGNSLSMKTCSQPFSIRFASGGALHIR